MLLGLQPTHSLLVDRLLRPLRLCRPDFQLIWGSSERHWDADLHEVQDFAAVLTDSLVSARVVAGGEVAASNASVQSQKLLVESLDWQLERHDDVLERYAGVNLLYTLTCFDPDARQAR